MKFHHSGNVSFFDMPFFSFDVRIVEDLIVIDVTLFNQPVIFCSQFETWWLFRKKVNDIRGAYIRRNLSGGCGDWQSLRSEPSRLKGGISHALLKFDLTHEQPSNGTSIWYLLEVQVVEMLVLF